MADMKKVYDDLIIINLYLVETQVHQYENATSKTISFHYNCEAYTVHDDYSTAHHV